MPNDRIVTARLILQAQLERQRRGHRRLLESLESSEPDLTEYLLETSTAHYHRILGTGVAPKEARRLHHAAEAMALTCIMALRKAHEALWQAETGDQLEAKLGSSAEPPLKSPPA